MSVDSKPRKLHKLFSPTGRFSQSSSAKRQPSFLVPFLCLFSWLCSSSSHHTAGQLPVGNVRAEWAPTPHPGSSLGGSQAGPCVAGLGAGPASAGRPSGALVLGWGSRRQVLHSASLCLNHTQGRLPPPITVSALCLPGADTRTARRPDAGPVLADTLRKFLFDLDVDDGLAAIGYSKADIPALVKGTLPQVRDTAILAPVWEAPGFRRDGVHLGHLRGGDGNPGLPTPGNSSPFPHWKGSRLPHPCLLPLNCGLCVALMM